MIDKSKKIDFVFYFYFLGGKKREREGLNSKKRSKVVGLGSLLVAGSPRERNIFDQTEYLFFCFYPNEISKKINE